MKNEKPFWKEFQNTKYFRKPNVAFSAAPLCYRKASQPRIIEILCSPRTHIHSPNPSQWLPASYKFIKYSPNGKNLVCILIDYSTFCKILMKEKSVLHTASMDSTRERTKTKKTFTQQKGYTPPKGRKPNQ